MRESAVFYILADGVPFVNKLGTGLKPFFQRLTSVMHHSNDFCASSRQYYKEIILASQFYILGRQL